MALLIKAVILENLRSCQERVIVPFAELIVFNGRNDTCKSTILNAPTNKIAIPSIWACYVPAPAALLFNLPVRFL